MLFKSRSDERKVARESQEPQNAEEEDDHIRTRRGKEENTSSVTNRQSTLPGNKDTT